MKSTKATILLAAGVLVLSLFCCGPVIAAPTLDLSVVSWGIIDSTARFERTSDQAAGIGLFDPFVRVHKESSGIEEGYNTDHEDFEFDTMGPGGGNYCHSLLWLTEVPVVNKGGIDYRQFALNFNEQGGADGRYLSLDELRIHLEAAGDLTGYPDNFGTPIYDLNPNDGDDNWIKLDYGLNNGGQGKADMLALIPDALFVGGEYVYLYSKFGVHIASDDGPEDWGVGVGGPLFIPAPGAIVLGGIGAGLVGWLRRRRSL